MTGTTCRNQMRWPASRSPRFGFGHLEQADPAAGSHHPAQLGEDRAEIGEVAQGVAAGDPVDRAGRPPAGRRRRPGPGAGRLWLAASIPHDRSIPTGRSPAASRMARKSPVPQARSSTREPAGRAEGPDRLPPPAEVEAEGHHAVDQVVARGDGVEHRPHQRGLLRAGREIGVGHQRRSGRRRQPIAGVGTGHRRGTAVSIRLGGPVRRVGADLIPDGLPLGVGADLFDVVEGGVDQGPGEVVATSVFTAGSSSA